MKAKQNKKPEPKTPSELAHYRVELNCELAIDALDGRCSSPEWATRSEYAISFLANAIKAMSDQIRLLK